MNFRYSLLISGVVLFLQCGHSSAQQPRSAQPFVLQAPKWAWVLSHAQSRKLLIVAVLNDTVTETPVSRSHVWYRSMHRHLRNASVAVRYHSSDHIGRELTAKYRLPDYPVLLFLHSDGTLLRWSDKTENPDEFLFELVLARRASLERVAAGKDSSRMIQDLQRLATLESIDGKGKLRSRGLLEMANLQARFEHMFPRADSTLARLANGEMTREKIWYLRARLAYRSGDTDRALHAIERALSYNPRHPESRALHGILIGEKGDDSAAIPHLLYAWQSRPADKELRIDVARHLARQNFAWEQIDSAALWYRRVLALRPHDTLSALKLAELHMSFHNPDSATIILQQLSDRVPECTRAHALLGYLALYADDDTASAVRHYHRAYRTDTTSTIALKMLGRIAVQKGDTTMAERYLGALHRTYPKDAEAIIEYGKALHVLHGLDRSLSFLQTSYTRLSATQQPEASLAARTLLQQLSQTLLRAGDTSTVINLYGDALMRWDDHVEDRIRYGLLLVSQKRLREALEALRPLLSSDIERASFYTVAHSAAGMAYEELGDLDSALIAFQRASARDSSMAVNFVRSAEICFNRGWFRRSSMITRSYIQANTESLDKWLHVQIHYWNTLSSFHLRDFERALTSAKVVTLRMRTIPPEFWEYYVSLLLGADRHDDANDVYEAALQMYETEPYAMYSRQRLLLSAARMHMNMSRYDDAHTQLQMYEKLFGTDTDHLTVSTMLHAQQGSPAALDAIVSLHSQHGLRVRLMLARDRMLQDRIPNIFLEEPHAY